MFNLATPRHAAGAFGLAGLLVAVAALTACQTDTEGVKSNALQQYTTVNAQVPAATRAVEATFNDLEFNNVSSTASKVDGEVTGETARGKEVKAVLESVGDNRTEITVWAGTTGDSKLGQRILSMTRDQLAD